ncbi:hypothetical protein HD806DRAFT_537803 [Xylariaceae sp. AK1471]|nr:hypothetical protein HD806DRAFT_537803 [Xylariaceae sp. AK1471]
MFESEKTTLHVGEDESGIKVYVPRDKDDQEYIFTNVFSQKLFHWMTRHPVTQISEGVGKDGVNATRGVLLAPYSKIFTALEDNDIAAIDTKTINEVIQEPEPPTTPIRGIVCAPTYGAESMHFINQGATASSRASSYRLARTIPRVEIPFRRLVPLPSFESPTPTRDLVTDQHNVDTLDTVITAARQHILLGQAVFGVHQIRANLPNSGHNTAELGLLSTSQIEKESKIGAAGELYVFELFSHPFEHQKLHGFSRNNWKSNMPKYVTVHHEYSDMEPWHRQETSDFTYLDHESTLTSKLIDKGFLARDMRDNVLTANDTGSIYAIFRAYWLGQDHMDLKIYLDPESLRLSGQLKFTAETWSIIPKEVDSDSSEDSK